MCGAGTRSVAVDTSVVVAAFASWHERHDDAREVVERDARLAAPAALETYAALTRLPGAYDALIAAIARHHEARLVTLDGRARETYERIGASVEYLGPG